MRGYAFLGLLLLAAGCWRPGSTVPPAGVPSPTPAALAPVDPIRAQDVAGALRTKAAAVDCARFVDTSRGGVIPPFEVRGVTYADLDGVPGEEAFAWGVACQMPSAEHVWTLPVDGVWTMRDRHLVELPSTPLYDEQTYGLDLLLSDRDLVAVEGGRVIARERWNGTSFAAP